MPRFPFPIDELDTPAILIDVEILDTNITRMQALANTYGIALRPHIKTHKSIELTKRQLKAGACGIAVAKLSEAEVMADAGITDIQIANQIVGKQKVERLAALASRTTISCAVDSAENVLQIAEIFGRFGLSIPLFIEIDSGLHRAGLVDFPEILRLAKLIQSSGHTKFAGLLTHAGHAYAARDHTQLKQIANAEGSLLVSVAESLRHEGIDTHTVSVGSTPTAKWAASTPGVTELRVGNYIFNDAIQVSLGVAQWNECALSVLTTITSVHEDRFVLDAGSKVFSSDAGAHGSARLSGFGQIVGMPLTISRLSEEHAVVAMSRPQKLSVGERLRVIPNHACPVMNLARHAWLVCSGEVIGEVAVDAAAMTS